MLSRRKISDCVLTVKTGAGYLEKILLWKEDKSDLQMNSLNTMLFHIIIKANEIFYF